MNTRLHTAVMAATFLVTTAASTANAEPAAESAATDRQQLAWSAVDADGNGEATRTEFQAAQVRAATQRFRRLDKDASGTLSPAEYAPALAEAKERRSRLPWIARRRMPEAPSFETIDADRDGGTTLKEWLASSEKRRAKMFERIDDDDSGSVSRQEFDEWQAKMKRFLGRRSGQ